MIQLTNKTPVKFTWSDALSESNVVVSPDDDSDTIAAKLQRVLELEGGRPAGAGVVDALVAMRQQAPVFTPTDREAMDARLEGVKVMGWNEDAAAGGGLEELPEIG